MLVRYGPSVEVGIQPRDEDSNSAMQKLRGMPIPHDSEPPAPEPEDDDDLAADMAFLKNSRFLPPIQFAPVVLQPRVSCADVKTFAFDILGTVLVRSLLHMLVFPDA
jgi:hypothetical protein